VNMKLPLEGGDQALERGGVTATGGVAQRA
jgi:hypothetical protein